MNDISLFSYRPVSYTHLDVYKRQVPHTATSQQPTLLNTFSVNVPIIRVYFFAIVNFSITGSIVPHTATSQQPALLNTFSDNVPIIRIYFFAIVNFSITGSIAVSYTHLDVYKRQVIKCGFSDKDKSSASTKP